MHSLLLLTHDLVAQFLISAVGLVLLPLAATLRSQS